MFKSIKYVDKDERELLHRLLSEHYKETTEWYLESLKKSAELLMPVELREEGRPVCPELYLGWLQALIEKYGK